MLLTIDVGNTNITYAVFDKTGQVIQQWRTMTSKESIHLNSVDISDIRIASVVPDIDDALATSCQSVYGCTPVFVSNETLRSYIDIQSDTPEQFGADRLVNVIAAKHIYKSPCIIVDFGTATTFDVLNEAGQYCGGLICPGVHLSAKSLHEATAKLPSVDIKKPEKLIGANTIDAMQSGLYWGYVSLIEGVIGRLKNELKAPDALIIATGGLASFYGDDITSIDSVDQNLTLSGLWRIFTLSHK